MEMVAAIVHQLTRNLTDEEVRSNPSFAPYFVDHTTGIYPTAASGFPWSAGSMQSTGDVIADLTEDLAAEQKARLTYDNILRLSDDPDVNNVIRFLREREIVHFQRFGECLRLCKEKMDAKNVYLTNPAFDKQSITQPQARTPAHGGPDFASRGRKYGPASACQKSLFDKLTALFRTSIIKRTAEMPHMPSLRCAFVSV